MDTHAHTHAATTAPTTTGRAPSTGPAAPVTMLLTLDEVARELRCARRSVERQITRHRLAAVHVGRSVRIERRELERYVAHLRGEISDPHHG
ncbi:helix-turn-helix domain-containing protein [Nocardioides sp. AX2bis]|uniref:helix-turn-helix domain-containing protein n=1 Tax=Nocardioides sp. AX2bis TaxID=2653157 RepID=UPI0012F0E8F6|nr:helix-turn-helix domain-containing protein [Nocardioides sp. AX2bis]VXC37736.1 hypothetical protein NOCARDAX2BIS_520148 [Nocardioides sp. AX2bis]